MSAPSIGADGALPAGFVRCAKGTLLWRGHSPLLTPDWFGPEVGMAGSNRFDLPFRAQASDPGVCYLAPTLMGVLVERVLRDVWRDALSITVLQNNHAVTAALVVRDLFLIDLQTTAWTIYGLQAPELTERPPYRATQEIAKQLAAVIGKHPGGDAFTPDGILYGSRFGVGIECVALWDRARDSLAWQATARLGEDSSALMSACERLGVGLLP